MSYLENEFFLLAITFGIYFFAKLLAKENRISFAKSYFIDHCRPDRLSENDAYQL